MVRYATMTGMGLREMLRRAETRKVLRNGDVLAVPYSMSALEMTSWVRRWAPDLRVTPEDGIDFSLSLRLLGPIELDEVLRRRERVPAGAASVYVVVEREHGPLIIDGVETDDLDSGDFVNGVAHRLHGWVRESWAREWTPGEHDDGCLQVFAPVQLTKDELLRVLAPDLPELRGCAPDDPDELYALTGGGLSITASLAEDACSTYPLVRLQPWFTAWTATTVYYLSDLGSSSGTLVAAARGIQEATGGVLLDFNGFPPD